MEECSKSSPVPLGKAESNPPGELMCSIYGYFRNRGIPKWMVKIMENPIKMDDLGVSLFLETPICIYK